MTVLLLNTNKHIRIDPYGIKDAIRPEEVIDFVFPDYGVLDLSSIRMFYNMVFQTSNAGGTHAMARDGETIINRLEVSVNGIVVNDINNYAQIYRILADFGYFGSHHLLHRHGMRSCLLNGYASPTNAAGANTVYYARQWLGLFGTKQLIDLRKNKIHVRITISPRQIIASPGANDSFTLNNVYLTCKYIENFNGDLMPQLNFSDFKSILQFNPTTSQETSLKIFTKNADFVVGALFKTNYKTIHNTITDGTTRYFERDGTITNYSSWNFKVNDRPVYLYAPPPWQFYESMQDIIPNGLRDSGLQAFPSLNNYCSNFMAVGAKIGFINQDPQEVEISFNTVQGTSSIANFSLMFVKVDNDIMVN